MEWNKTNKKRVKKESPEEIQKCFEQEFNKYPPLTDEEEKDLIKKIEERDEEAKKKLIQSNLRLLPRAAKWFKNLNPDIDLVTLISAGDGGLLKSAEGVDWRSNYKFSTFATLLIRKYILRDIEILKKRKSFPEEKPKESKTIELVLIPSKSIKVRYGDKEFTLVEWDKLSQIEKHTEIIKEINKTEVKKNLPEIINLLSEVIHIQESEAKKEIEKFLKEE